MTNSTDPPGDGHPSRADLVTQLVGRWQHELSDLGGRNALLWFQDLPDTTLDLTGGHPSGIAKLFSVGRAPLSELIRQDGARVEARRRSRAIARNARRLYAERSLDTCHLASGMARWHLPGSPRTPVAPIFLRRCTITEDGGVVELSGDLRLNPALLAYLESEVGVTIDTDRICAAAGDGTRSDPTDAYALVQEACADLPDFHIDRRIVVGLFSLVKIPLLQDLSATLGDAVHHPVVAALAGDPDAIEQVGATPPATGIQPVDEELLACDADHEQQDVVEAVRAGAHLVVQGPPGTGKTQTAANLVAALAAEGRRTLFVSHQRAAVEALRARLNDAGLTDLVLDLHRRSAQPGQVAGHLVDVLDERLGGRPDPGGAPASLVSHRDQLQAHVETMHCVRSPWGVTVDEAQDRVTALEQHSPPPRSRVRLTAADLSGISAHRRDELREELRQVAEMEAWTSIGDPDPWFGARIVGTQQLQRAQELVKRLGKGGLADHRREMDDLCEQVGLPAPRSLREAQDHLDLMAGVHGTLETFRPEIYSAPLDSMVAATGTRDDRREQGVHVGAVDRRRLRRQATALLRPGPPPRAIHAVLERAARQRHQWRTAAGPGSLPSAPAKVADLADEHEQLRQELEWLGERLADTGEGGALLDADLDALERRLARLADTPDRLAKVPKVIASLDTLRANGLDAFIDDMAARQLPTEQALVEFDFVWWVSVLQQVGAEDDAYDRHDGPTIRDVASAYAQQDASQVRRAAGRVGAMVADRTRSAAEDFPDQVDTLRAVARSDTAASAGRLLQDAPELVGALAPCWAMGVLDVPSMVPPGMWFDVVVCDEGSRITPADAAAAMVRASQIVVFGDDRQLPPAPLVMGEPDDDPAPGEGETSLPVLLGSCVPRRTLHTHYRCVDERLMTFAGAQLYAHQLQTFPSADSDGALRLDVVSGHEDGSETERVVELVIDHARRHPDRSLAVVTLTEEHARRVDEALRHALAADLEADGALHSHASEPFFVRSVDHVQGEVRDRVILSVGFARQPDGAAPHRFGALSASGGERRLGVAITRARRSMVVVSSFSGGELDPARLRSRGATMLRDVLLYAASGGSARRMEAHKGRGTTHVPVQIGPHGRRRRMASSGSVLDRPTVSHDESIEVSPLVEDLARRMHAEGLVAHTAYGLGPRRIDLAVEDPRRPGTVLVAVETDGPLYGAAASPRDRDRLWVEQLRRRGWHHERVWTRDLFRDPAQEVARLVSAVHAESNRRRSGHA